MTVLKTHIPNLEETALLLVQEGKGILAADESTPTIKKRLASIGVESTEENRSRYRELLFTTKGLNEYISGVILFDETIHQANEDGQYLIDMLLAQDIIPGIKVDKGLMPLANFSTELITKGIDDLPYSLDRYRELGARFTKWRAVIKIGKQGASQTAIKANCHLLARFAAISQLSGLVPIVEPEVLMDGEHDLSRCELVSTETITRLFSELRQHHVHLEGMLLKASMVTSGSNCLLQSTADQVALATTRLLRRTLPAAVPGVVFLSGGQTPERATTNLNAININDHHPWQLSFSFGRALQQPVLETWRGKNENVIKAQQSLLSRARLNSKARYGKLEAK